MDAASVFLGRKLTERIKEKQAEMMHPLLAGRATDYADYRDRAAFLRALGDVIEWMKEIDAEEDNQGRSPFARDLQTHNAPRRTS